MSHKNVLNASKRPHNNCYVTEEIWPKSFNCLRTGNKLFYFINAGILCVIC